MVWEQVHAELARAEPLGTDDLERLATAAFMLGRHEEYLGLCERLHRERLEAGLPLPAARAAFWLGMQLILAGEMGQGMGWMGRAQKLVERAGTDCAERGYLMMPMVFQRDAGGDLEGAAEIAAAAGALGEQFADPELSALAGHAYGHLLIRLGRVDEGLQQLDDAMLSATIGELSPMVSGIVYCGVILACQDAFDHRRAREWTAALSRWCDRQEDMVAFTGRCRVHRAEILQREGDWERALEEARVGAERAVLGGNLRAAGDAAYVRGELHRLQGRPADAEAAYREAGSYGREPQPGLALLRAAQGDRDAAAASIRRALAEADDAPRRANLLPAAVEILLMAEAEEEARAACRELEAIAAGHGGAMLAAMAAHARGAVALMEDDARAALPALRRAMELWTELGAPYDAARSRLLLSVACRGMGDEDSAGMEADGARETLARLGAADGAGPPRDGHGLSDRELEVLRLVAAGHTNRAIAGALVLSERTVHRHVSNIFAKLRVSSRAAATAYAYEHGLV